jgi:hypothetical protein
LLRQISDFGGSPRHDDRPQLQAGLSAFLAAADTRGNRDLLCHMCTRARKIIEEFPLECRHADDLKQCQLPSPQAREMIKELVSNSSYEHKQRQWDSISNRAQRIKPRGLLELVSRPRKINNAVVTHWLH